MEMLGAITGLIGAGLSASNQAQANAIAMANLQFQKQMAERQMRMSQAARSDAYGNKQYYDELSNEWIVKLTPTQKSITNAGEQEQLKSLTTDAQRKRMLAQRQEQRSFGAERPYNAAYQGYMYDQPASKSAMRNELETLILMANQDAAKSNQDTLARQALRLGRGGDIPRLIKATDDKLGTTVGGSMLQALQGAEQMHKDQVQQHDQQYLPELAAWQKIMDDGGGESTQRFSNVPEQLDSIQGQQQSAMLGAIRDAASNIGSAYKGLAASAGQPSPFAGIKFPSMGEGKTRSGKTKLSSSSGGAWDQGIDWGSTPDYLFNMDWGGWGGSNGPTNYSVASNLNDDYFG